MHDLLMKEASGCEIASLELTENAGQGERCVACAVARLRGGWSRVGPCSSVLVSPQMQQVSRREGCRLVVSEGPQGPELEGAWRVQAPPGPARELPALHPHAPPCAWYTRVPQPGAKRWGEWVSEFNSPRQAPWSVFKESLSI